MHRQHTCGLEFWPKRLGAPEPNIEGAGAALKVFDGAGAAEKVCRKKAVTTFGPIVDATGEQLHSTGSKRQVQVLRHISNNRRYWAINWRVKAL